MDKWDIDFMDERQPSLIGLQNEKRMNDLWNNCLNLEKLDYNLLKISRLTWNCIYLTMDFFKQEIR